MALPLSLMDNVRDFLGCSALKEEVMPKMGCSKSIGVSSLQRAISILLQYASVFEGLFTVPVPDAVARAAWEGIPLDPGVSEKKMKEKDVHSLAGGLLLHLQDLNGSLMTEELHDRFIAAAAISSRYSQIYVFRLLLGELPPINHTIFKNLALLLRCTTLRNNSAISKQVIVTFGRLLMKRRYNMVVVHRQLTAVEAGILFIVVLMEEWNYLFQYGRASFADSRAKVCPAPHLETGLLKISKSGFSNASDVCVRSERGRTLSRCAGIHGNSYCNINQQDSDMDLETRSGNSEIRLASAPVEANMSPICCEPRLHGDRNIPFSGSLTSKLQTHLPGQELAHGDYPQSYFSVSHELRRNVAGLRISSQPSGSSPGSSQLTPGSEACYDDDSSVLQMKPARRATENLQEKSFKEQEVSCDVPSYWKHWFEEKDLKFCHDLLKYAVGKSRGKQEIMLSKAGDSSGSSTRSFQREELLLSQEQPTNKFSWGENVSLPKGSEDGKGTTGTAKRSETVEESCQTEKSLFTLGGCRYLDKGSLGKGSPVDKNSLCSQMKNSFSHHACPLSDVNPETNIIDQDEEGQLFGRELSTDTSASESMKSTNSRLSSSVNSTNSRLSSSMKSTSSRLSSQELSFANSELPLSCLDYNLEEGSKEQKNALDFKEGRSSSQIEVLLSYRGLQLSSVCASNNTPDWEDTKLPSKGGYEIKAASSGNNVVIPMVTCQTGGFCSPQDGCLTRQGISGSRQHRCQAPEIICGDKLSTTLVPLLSKVTADEHGSRSAKELGELSKDVWQSDVLSSLSSNCLDRLQSYVENVLCKESKGFSIQDQFQMEGAAELPRKLVTAQEDLNPRSTEKRLFTMGAAIRPQSKSFENLEEQEMSEPKTGSIEMFTLYHNPEWSNDPVTPSQQHQRGIHGLPQVVQDHKGSQAQLSSIELDSNKGPLRECGIPIFSLDITKSSDNQKCLESCESLSNTTLFNLCESGTQAIKESSWPNVVVPQRYQEATSIGCKSAAPHLSTCMVSAGCQSTQQQICIDVHEQGINSSLPQRVCNRICTSLTQSKKNIEGVLGACADAVVTSLLPVLEPSVLLGQEVILNPEGCSQFSDTWRTTNATPGSSLVDPCIAPGPVLQQKTSVPAPLCPPTPQRCPSGPPSTLSPVQSTTSILTPTETPSLPSPPVEANTTGSRPPKISAPPPPPPPPKLPAPHHPPKKSAPPAPPKTLPPPPPKILAPPPPPPPGLVKSSSNIQIKRPKMKQLIWDKITGPTADLTVWKTTAPSSITMDLEELESLFAVNETNPEKSHAKAVSVGKKSQGVQVLDLKRAHNIGIQLRSLRKPVPELCQALRDKEMSVLTMEVLNVLLNTLPTEEDKALLDAYQGDPSELAEVEMYYVELLRIPRHEKLIKAFIFKGQYDLTFQQIQQELKLLEHACDELKGSQSFKKILEMVLAVGNYLNGDSFRGAARGFKLGALLKLMDVKSHNKKTTLLHFVVAELMRTDEKVVHLTEESRAVKGAANLSLERLQSGLRELEHGLELVKVEVAVVKEMSPEDQQLLCLMMPFYEKAEGEVQGLKELHQRTLAKLKDLAVYFGETLKDERLIDLFRTMREFLFMFDQVTTELREAKRREIENMSKRSPSSSSYSCPASPAHKGLGKKDSIRSLDNASSFTLAPKSDKQKKLELSALSSHLKTSGSSASSSSSLSSFLDTSLSKFTELEKEETSMYLKNVENCKTYLPRDDPPESLGPVSSSSWNDKIVERPDPISPQSICYDSDWSTG